MFRREANTKMTELLPLSVYPFTLCGNITVFSRNQRYLFISRKVSDPHYHRISKRHTNISREIIFRHEGKYVTYFKGCVYALSLRNINYV